MERINVWARDAASFLSTQVFMPFVNARFRAGFFVRALALGAASLAGCSGAQHVTPAAPSLGLPVTADSLQPARTAMGRTATATLSLRIPLRRDPVRRQPRYVPASIKSLSVGVLKVDGSSVASSAVTTPISPGVAPCGSASGSDYTCVITVVLPIGTDTVQITTYDGAGGSGNVLSQALSSVSVVEGKTNSFSGITLDANPGALTVTASTGASGTFPSFTATSGTPTFSVTQVDAHGTAFASQPGLPVISHAAATGTGASASVSSGSLALTPPASGSSNVVVDADPAGSVDFNTTLASAATSGATSVSLTSASGVFPGARLVFDYEAFNGSTLLQESGLVTAVSGNTVTIGTPLLHTHASGAAVRHYSDNLAPSAAQFTVTVAASFIAPVAQNFSSGESEALVYNASGVLQTGSLTNPNATYGYARFDSAGRLYIADLGFFEVYRSQYTAGTGFGGVATYSGIPISQAGDIDFDVGPDGAVVVQNPFGTSPNLDIFGPGTSSSPATFTSGLGGSWESTTSASFATVAALIDASGTTFGYAYEVDDSFGGAHDEVVVTNGTSEQDLSSSAMVSDFGENDLTPVLAWDQGRQSLIYANAATGAGSTYAILEFSHTGATHSATVSTTPTTIAGVPGNPQAVAVSRDGAYVAVAWENADSAVSVTLYHNNGVSWSAVTTLGTTFQLFTAMHFLSNGNLAVTNSGNLGSSAELYTFTTTGSQVGSSFNLEPGFGSGYTVNDFAVSY
jgi:hypothetical protein